jgi:predicted chitinase
VTKMVLEEIKQELMAANAVKGEEEFCVAWLGKNASYMRTLRFQQLQPSADALVVCASKLNYYRAKLEYSSEARHKAWAQRFAVLHEKCSAALNEQAEAKWRVAERMGVA